MGNRYSGALRGSVMGFQRGMQESADKRAWQALAGSNQSHINLREASPRSFSPGINQAEPIYEQASPVASPMYEEAPRADLRRGNAQFGATPHADLTVVGGPRQKPEPAKDADESGWAQMQSEGLVGLVQNMKNGMGRAEALDAFNSAGKLRLKNVKLSGSGYITMTEEDGKLVGLSPAKQKALLNVAASREKQFENSDGGYEEQELFQQSLIDGLENGKPNRRKERKGEFLAFRKRVRDQGIDQVKAEIQGRLANYEKTAAEAKASADANKPTLDELSAFQESLYAGEDGNGVAKYRKAQKGEQEAFVRNWRAGGYKDALISKADSYNNAAKKMDEDNWWWSGTQKQEYDSLRAKAKKAEKTLYSLAQKDEKLAKTEAEKKVRKPKTPTSQGKKSEGKAVPNKFTKYRM